MLPTTNNKFYLNFIIALKHRTINSHFLPILFFDSNFITNPNKIKRVFSSEKCGQVTSSFIFRNWNTCFPLLMDRKNRFYYSFTNSYVNFYATAYYTNIVADIASFNLMQERQTRGDPSSSPLKNRLFDLLNPCYKNFDADLNSLVDEPNIHRFFKHYSEGLKPRLDWYLGANAPAGDFMCNYFFYLSVLSAHDYSPASSNLFFLYYYYFIYIYNEESIFWCCFLSFTKRYS